LTGALPRTPSGGAQSAPLDLRVALRGLICNGKERREKKKRTEEKGKETESGGRREDSMKGGKRREREP